MRGNNRMSKTDLTNVWHFRTIGLGTINYRVASNRLAREVSGTGIFSTSIGYDERFLKKFSLDFWKAHRTFLKARNPGYGWWVWKPEFIRKCLQEIPEGHGLMYSDAGNYISSAKSDLETLTSYLNLANEHNVVGSNSQGFLEKDWSSPELMNLLNLNDSARNSNQFLGGFLLVTNSPEGRNFISNWANLVCLENHKFLLPGLYSNHSSQVGSYDQSILSCLLKQASKPSVYVGDSLNLGSIRAVRHRYGFPFHNANKFSVIVFKTISLLSRIRLALERRFLPKTNNRGSCLNDSFQN